MVRLAALLLAVLLLFPRAALGAIVLHCGDPSLKAADCCCCSKKQRSSSGPTHERAERASCCSVEAPGHVPASPATVPPELQLPALALAGPSESLPAPPVPELSAGPALPLARGPPPSKQPLYLTHCSLLH